MESFIYSGKYKAYSLAEILLVIGLLGVLAVITIPVSVTAVYRNDLRIADTQVTQALRTANSYSRSSKDDDSWGVRIQNGEALIFKGDDFATRDTSFDESLTFSTEIGTSGINEVWFTKIEAVPSTTGNVTLTSQQGESKSININDLGAIESN